MKHVTWIPVISICAAFALSACDQPQTPPGQPSGTANEQGEPLQNQNLEGQDQGGTGSQSGNASQSSIDTDPANLTRGVALLDGTPSASSTRWTLISDPPAADGRSN